MSKPRPNLPRARYHHLKAVAAASVAAVAVFGSLAAYQATYAGRIFPGVSLGSLALGGLTPEAAEAQLQVAWDSLAARGIPLAVGERMVVLSPRLSSPTDPDLAYDLIHFNAEAAAQVALAYGRQGGWLTRFAMPFLVRLAPRRLPPPADVDEARVLKFLRDSLPGLEQQPVPARFAFDQAGNVGVTPGEDGMLIDVAAFRRELEHRLAAFATDTIVLALRRVPPDVGENDLVPLLPEVRRLARERNLTFAFGEERWLAEPATWHHWIALQRAEDGLRVGFSGEAAAGFFAPIVKALNQPARDAKFELRDSRVATFEPSQPGRTLDVAASLAAAEAIVRSDDPAERIPLSVTVTEPKVTTADANEFGIAEIIGVGTSNFKGSPKNRRHNIRVGAASLNGILIKPEEEFSLLAALGEISAETGYLEELVIKGNKTIPEFGGGLCQIGTTTFRAALAAGLPILERRNHSYRVVYYEPAGTDATIYNPKPDFRFKNDTGSNILIQTRIEGDDLIFEFWGKRDGRTVEQTKPRIFNITPPPPTKIVETEDLAPGEKKCTERPHAGADTEFTYTVTYADGRREEQVFKSHYVPWQEVCLVGVPKGTLQDGAGGSMLPSPDTQGQAGN